MSCTVVSSSGKVMLAGGYLVLDPNYSCIVVSTSSRFYTVIRQAQPPVKNEIHVRSPQFLDAIWHYGVQWHDRKISLEQIKNKSECALSFALLSI
jgi:phosphomevalonate kinase